MSRHDAEKIARLYDGFYAEQEPFTGPIPRCVCEPIPANSPPISPLEFIAGAILIAIVGVLFFGV